MRAVECYQIAESPYDSLRLVSMPSKSPRSEEVIVEVHACGLSFPIMLMTQGKYQGKPKLPFIPGDEIAGIVKAVGQGVTRVRRGQKVLIKTGPSRAMNPGGFATEVCVPEKCLTLIPDGMSMLACASVGLNFGTTYFALKTRANLQPGETLVVLGASGGTGTSAIQLGKIMGARVIACASSDAKLKICKRLGADITINYSRVKNLKKALKKATNKGVDVVYDAVGGDMAEQALRAMAWYGRYLVIGFASGKIPKIPANLILLKQCQVVGVFWGAWRALNPAKATEHLEKICTWVLEGKIDPMVSDENLLSLEQVPEGLQRFRDRAVVGKMVCIPNGKSKL